MPYEIYDVAALFIDPNGPYSKMAGVDCWAETRDARQYPGPHPVVAHPPCQLWGNFARINYDRWGGEHNRPGNDQGCFKSALASVRKYGGVLEHPAFTKAWASFKLIKPPVRPGPHWMQHHFPGNWPEPCSFLEHYWVTEIWQSAYGHLARKRTWLLYVGAQPPFELRWDRNPGTHQIGYHDQRGKAANKPTVSKKEASRTPVAFAEDLVRLARWSRG